MKKHISDALQVLAAILITGGVVASAAPVPTTTETHSEVVALPKVSEPVAPETPAQAPVEQKVATWQDNPNKCNLDTQYIAKEPPFTCIDKSAPTVNVAPAAAPSASNEAIAWNFLVSQGFTSNQAAGIMGNLQQEHNFKTDDVPGGLGIAQWMGNRRANLMARPDYLNINVQLQFLMDELNSTERAAKNAILASGSVDGATIAFSNLFERCGVCHNDKRISYGYAILNRYAR